MTKDESVSFKEELFNHIHELLEINPRQTAMLILREFSSSIATILEILKDPQLLFQFLNGILDPSTVPWPFQDASLLNAEYHEKYIELLCQNKPDLVTTFLTMSESYRLEEAIEAVKKHHVHDALAYLLEKQGNVQGAVSVLLENLKNKLNSLAESFHFKQGNTELGEFNTEIPGLYNVQTSLEEMIKLCQRSSRNLNFEQKEALWFPLLELIMAPSHHLKTKISSPFADGIKLLTKMVLNSITDHIPPTAILQKVIQDPGYSMGKFGDVRDLTLGMLDTFVYEQTLMETTKNILNRDLHCSLSNLRAMMNRGLKPHHKICGICTKHYSERLSLEEEVILFSCGHIYHSYCLQSKDCFGEFGADQNWLCFKCTSSKRTGKTVNSVKPASQQMSLPTKIATKATRQTPDKEKLTLLLDLARHNAAVTDNTKIVPVESIHYFNQSSIIRSKNFQLQLVPPPLVD
uniref:RING-type domain-containing protein n=1 Tax=Callorhinchus milii TaxID=7868 RepID=A0A4W3J767_CALMI